MADSLSDDTKGRRSFLKLSILLISGLVVTVTSFAVSRFAFFNTKQKKHRFLRLEDFQAINNGEPCFIPQAEVWVIKGENLSSSVALDDRCTHLGCKHKWNPEKQIFECPCHGSEFDIRGAVVRGPASRALPRMVLAESSDKILFIPEQSADK
ncbi:MAG: Rieske 2Fe-2S domain-containing protein [Pseudomonadota bacterium]